MLFSSVGFVNAQSIEEQLRSAREQIDRMNKGLEPDPDKVTCLSFCYPGKSENLTTQMIINSYDPSENKDRRAFLESDYGKEFLAYYERLELEANTPNRTEEAKKARALFDKYW